MIIAHLSDSHLRPDGQLYEGVVDSNAMFAAAVMQVNALHPQPDLVILSGDLTENGTAAEYGVARQILAGLQAPLLLLAGNHDQREPMRAAFADNPYMAAAGPLHGVVTDLGPVRVIALDVTVPGYHHGEVTSAALTWLEATLAEDRDRPTLIVMHQPPFSTGIAFMDQYRCFGDEGLKTLLARYPAVERVACGHVHRFLLRRFGTVLACTAPSTTTAIALRLDPASPPASQIDPPAFLLHHWREGEGLTTHLVPIGDFEGPFEFF